ncbi:MAG TPA: hypothetical protein PLO63_07260 [Syntrophales bacterium]|nr:hypothetical protein [Syntrophales bacterium]
MAAVDRYEVNRKIRNILVRYDVDTTRIDYSFIGNTAYLYGELLKNRKGDEFDLGNLEQMVKEITRINGVRYIQFDLRNWVINYSGMALSITKGKTASAPQTISAGDTGMGMDVELKVDKEEKPRETLRKEEEKKEKKEA